MISIQIGSMFEKYHGVAFVAYLILSGVGVWLLMWWTDFEGMRSAYHFHLAMRSREALTLQAFCDQHCAGTAIPMSLVEQFLKFEAAYWCVDIKRIRPDDFLMKVFGGGIDLLDYFHDVERRFHISLKRSEIDAWIGTFDHVLRCLNAKLNQGRALPTAQ